MTFQSCSDRFPETGFRVQTSTPAKRSNIAKIALMAIAGAFCLTAMVGGTTAGLLFASGIFQ